MRGTLLVGLALLAGCGKPVGERAEQPTEKASAKIAKVPPPEPSKPVTEQLVKWGNTASIGSARIKLKTASLSGVIIERINGPAGTEVGLLCELVITNTDPTKNLSASAAYGGATLHDTYGNKTDPIFFDNGFGQRARMRGSITSRADVRSDETVDDVVMFSMPVPAAKNLALRLNASLYGGDGAIVFDIPESAWRPKK